MLVDANSSFQYLFTRKNLIKSPESLRHARVVRREIFERQMDDGTVAFRLLVVWLQLANGEVIPAVARADLSPLMEEILAALEALDV